MYFFLIFHHNLAFSSIPRDHYPYLIDNVYSRILDLADHGLALGLEFTGHTLETIERFRPSYIARLRQLLDAGHCEIIGSSYSQAIFPLIPAPVNRWNIAFGQETYEKILGVKPFVYYLNEQVYSESMPELFGKAGAKALVFDWMNARTSMDWPADYRYRVIRHQPSGIDLIWSDSIAFQKLQRTVWADIGRDEYLRFLTDQVEFAHRTAGDKSCFCLYASDAEVFNYFPGRLLTATTASNHFDRLYTTLEHALRTTGASLVLPGLLPGLCARAQVASVTTADYPLRTKKQDKYNVLRWAVTGREATKMNSQCHHLFNLLSALPPDTPEHAVRKLRQELVSLWGSDFRTHTTEEKYDEFHNRMGKTLADLSLLSGKQGVPDRDGPATRKKKSTWTRPDTLFRSEAGTVRQEERHITVTTPESELRLIRNRGLAIAALSFSSCSSGPLAGTIPHGFYADIGLGSDFYSGHIILVTQDGKQITDLSCPVREIEICATNETIHLRNRHPMDLPGLSVQKTLTISPSECTLWYSLYASDLRPASLRLGIWTLTPGSYHPETLFFASHQGGDDPEIFALSGVSLQQDKPVNSIVTARHCIGSSRGATIIGDHEKGIEIQTHLDELYSIPLLRHTETRAWDDRPTTFTRIYHSICERDDVANVFWKGHLKIRFTCRPVDTPSLLRTLRQRR